MGVLDQLDLDAIKATYRADLPTPVDVLNLIHLKDEEAYKRYGLLVSPLLKAVGAEVGWMGKHVEAFVGEPRAEKLLVVRYPNQRRFFALALNPYYLVVANPQRLKGVRKFEASFTHSPDSLGALRRSRWVLVVHSQRAPGAVQRIVEASGGQRVYESVETSPIKVTKRSHPADTNPLVFPYTMLFRFESREACHAGLQSDALDQLREVGGELSVQLYQRLPKKDALPEPLARLLR